MIEVIDKDGKWVCGDNYRILIEPSEQYLNALNSDIKILTEPTTEEVLTDLLQLLTDKGVIY